MQDKIIIKGARVHNLKNVSLEIPKNKLIAFTGVSGSGKSSLAFDTIFAEGQRKYVESLSPYIRQFLGQMERPDVSEIIGLSPAIAINQKALSHNPRSTVGTLTEIYDYLRVLFARVGKVYCPKCGHLIEKLSLDEITDILEKKAREQKTEKITLLSPVVRGRKGEYYQMLYDFLSLGYSRVRIDGQFYSLHEKVVLSRYKNHDIDLVIDEAEVSDRTRLIEAVESALSHSKGLVKGLFPKEELLLSSNWTCPNDNFSFPEVEPRLFSFNSPAGACPGCFGLGKTEIFSQKICPECEGQRLKPESLSVRIGGKNIAQITALTIEEARHFFENFEKKLSERQKIIVSGVIKEIGERLSFLLKVGLDYISLNREADTLSGGEAQRIRLASQIGSHLSNTLYVLDEPTIGLHERDIDKLVETLKSLRDKDNTVIVVEHDERSIFESDYLVDLGPLAGKLGGEIVARGETTRLIGHPEKYPHSLTLQYLSEKKKIEIPTKYRDQMTEKIRIIGGRANNLKNINADLPLRKFLCLTGVSGSGKSSLLYDVLYQNGTRIKNFSKEKMEKVSRIEGLEYIDRIVMVDQSPIGRTPRSNPATYTGIFTPIREFFASLEASRERGYLPSRFSFNVPGGRCEACSGAGATLIEMHFLPPVWVPCEVCQGRRFSRETLQIKHKQKNIYDILKMTVDEALEFFAGFYAITDKLKVLQEVGMGYIELGQSATTLSGGEAQRIKLSRELTAPLGRRALFLLDEPTVGLHYHDIELLLKVINKLVEKGNSVFMIEHNLHMIKSADYVVDLGPEGGEKGGRIVAQGTPQDISRSASSLTGKYLRPYLK